MKNILIILVAVGVLTCPDALLAQDEKTKFIEGLPKITVKGYNVNHEYPGLTKSTGYDYPDENAGTQLYPNTKDYYLFSPLAKSKDGAWVLVVSPKHPGPVWINTNQAWSLEEEYAVPVFKELPAVQVPIPQELIASQKPVTGVYNSPDGRAYTMPESYSRNVACNIPLGAKISAVAMLADGLDVLVKTQSCKGYAWTWKINIDWDNRIAWTDLELPIIKPRLSRKPVLPEIEYVSRTSTEPPPKKADTFLTVLIRDTNGKAHEWQKDLPESWKPKANAHAELFVTIRKLPVIIDVCLYTPSGAFAKIRLDYALFLTFKDPTQLIAKTVIPGQKPPSCPLSKSSKDPSKVIGKPEIAELTKWLEPYVTDK